MTPIFSVSTSTLVNLSAPETFDLTALSGGLSYVNGINGGDFADTRLHKALGDGRIADPVPFNLNTTGITAVPTTALNGQPIANTVWLNADTGDGSGTGSSGTSSESRAWGLPGAPNGDTTLDWGIDRTISLKGQHFSRFTWIGGANGGDWTVTATLADGSAAPLTIALDGRSRIYDAVRQFWTCSVRTVNDTSITFRIKRTAAANGVYGTLWEQAWVVTPYGKPTLPRGLYKLAHQRGIFG